MVRENGLLADALVEHDPDDSGFGDPTEWPSWTRLIEIGLSPPITPDEVIPDPPDPPDPTPDPNQPPDDDFEELAEDWEPAPDPDELADFLERVRYEAGCRMRFI